MARDWLIRPECPLCGREDVHSGRAECAKGYTEDQRVDAGAWNICWWCFRRLVVWAGDNPRRMNPLTTAEFVAHVMQRKPKWFLNPEAHHPCKKIPREEVKRRVNQRKANLTEARSRAAQAIRSVPKAYRRAHYLLVASGKTVPRDFKKGERSAALSVPGIIECDCRDSNLCVTEEGGKCIISLPLRHVHIPARRVGP